MPKPVPYEQIRREVMAKRKMKPWEIVVARGHEEEEDEPEEQETIASRPLALAQQRAKINAALAPVGEAVNPETEAAKRKKKPHKGLMNLLMNVMAR